MPVTLNETFLYIQFQRFYIKKEPFVQYKEIPPFY